MCVCVCVCVCACVRARACVCVRDRDSETAVERTGADAGVGVVCLSRIQPVKQSASLLMLKGHRARSAQAQEHRTSVYL